MSYFVFWSPEADESLQAILGRVGERSDLVRVAREIDFWLARASVWNARTIRASPARTARLSPKARCTEGCPRRVSASWDINLTVAARVRFV